MPKPLTFILNARAKRQIADADRWWKEHREASNLIADEIQRITGLLLLNPFMGPAAENARRPSNRRFYLERIDYHLYYRVDLQRARIVIVAFWHAHRRPL